MSDPTNAPKWLQRSSVATSKAGLERVMKDQATLARGRWNATSDENRYTPAGLSEAHYRALRADRDQLDSKEWNEHTGYSGVHRWPDEPGMPDADEAALSDDERRALRQQRRARRRMEIDDGF